MTAKKNPSKDFDLKKYTVVLQVPNCILEEFRVAPFVSLHVESSTNDKAIVAARVQAVEMFIGTIENEEAFQKQFKVAFICNGHLDNLL